MRRILIGTVMIFGATTSTAWAQEVAKPEPPPVWPLILVGSLTVYVLLLIIYVFRRQKYQKVIVGKSLELAGERNDLARQQIALQKETNRLLEQLIAKRG